MPKAKTIALAVLMCVGIAASARAQSAIAGVVKDTSGAVLPLDGGLAARRM